MALPTPPQQGFLQSIGSTIQKAPGDAWNFLYGGAANVAKDIGVGAGLNQTPGANQSNQDAIALAKQAFDKSFEVSDPAQKKRLQDVAKQTLATVGQTSGDTSRSFSPDIQENYGTRSLNAATQIATGADVFAHPIATIKAPFQLAKAGYKGVKALAGATSEDVSAAMGGLKNVPQAVGNFLKDDFSKSFKLPNATPKGLGAIPQVEKAAPIAEAPQAQKEIMLTPNQAPKDAVANYQAMFEIPRPVAQRMKIKPGQVVNQLINDGVTNVSNLDDLRVVANNVTSEDGAFPKINRIILGDIQTPIDFNETINTMPKTLNKYLEGSPKGLVNTVTNEIRRALPGGGEEVMNGLSSGEELFDASQELGKIKSMYDRKAYTQMGDLTNPDYERAGQAIGEIKATIDDALDNATRGTNYQAYKSDPRVLEQLKRVPPAIAQRWLDKAVQFRDGRSIQAPYVALSNMLDHTEDAQMTAFTKLRGAIGTPRSEMASHAITHPVESIQGMAQPGLQKVLSPLIDKAPEDIMRERTSGISATMKPRMSVGNPTKEGVLPYATPLFQHPVGDNTNQANKQPGEEQSGQDSQYHGASITQNQGDVNTMGSKVLSTNDLPQSVGDVQLNPDGTIEVAAPTQIQDSTGKIIAIDPNETNRQIQALQDDIAAQHKIAAADPYTPGTQTATAQTIEADKAQLESLKALSSSSGGLTENYKHAKMITGRTSSAIKTLQGVSPNIGNLNNQINDLQNNLDPAYAGLKQQLIGLQKNLNGDNLDVKTKDALISVLKTINQQNVFDYYQAIQGFAQPPVQAQNQPNFAPQSSPYLPDVPQDFSSISQGTPQGLPSIPQQ